MAMAMVMAQLEGRTHSTTGRRLTISENLLWRLIWLLRRYTCYRLPARLDVTFTPSSCSLFVSFVWIHYLIDKPWDLFKSVLTLGVKKKKPLEVEVRRLIPRVVLTTKVRLCSSLILFAHAFTGLENSPSSATGRFEMRKAARERRKESLSASSSITRHVERDVVIISLSFSFLLLRPLLLSRLLSIAPGCNYWCGGGGIGMRPDPDARRVFSEVAGGV